MSPLLESKIIITTATVGGSLVLLYACKKLSSYLSIQRQNKYFQEKCDQWPKDVVVLHGTPRGKLAPHPSPFVLKLETFLRMHKIPYIFESEFPKGEKQKMPWITLNKEHFTDSQLIIQLLKKKFNLKSNENYNAREKASGTMARIMLDEHFFWGLLLWRYVYANGEQLDEIFNMSPKEIKTFEKSMNSKYKEYSWYQGIGRHTREEVIEIMKDDLQALSGFLGTNNFLLGEEPSDDDCAVFGMLAQYIWNDVKSPYTKFILDKLPNLKEYCLRMKARYWPDWDKVIQQQLV